MLKKTYRTLLIFGIAVGVVTGVFFLCSVQRQITTEAEEAELRRQNEQNARIWMAPKELADTVIFASSSIPWELYQPAAKLIPDGWQYAPAAISKENYGSIAANNTQDAGASVIYSTPELFSVAALEVTAGSPALTAGTCAASDDFLKSYGLSVGGTVQVDGQEIQITASFSMPEKASEADSFLSLTETSRFLILPYEMAGENNAFLQYISLKKPEALGLDEFEAGLAGLETQLNRLTAEHENEFFAKTEARLLEDSDSRRRTSGPSIFAAILLLAFLGEFLAGINLMSLAGAGILESRQKLGLRLAVGASYGALFREFAGELLLICAKGALLGISAASVLVYYCNRAIGDFLFLFDWATVLMAAGVIFCACFAAAYFPFRAVLKRQPVALLRQD